MVLLSTVFEKTMVAARVVRQADKKAVAFNLCCAARFRLRFAQSSGRDLRSLGTLKQPV
jgi:hypothetical protein